MTLPVSCTMPSNLPRFVDPARPTLGSRSPVEPKHCVVGECSWLKAVRPCAARARKSCANLKACTSIRWNTLFSCSSCPRCAKHSAAQQVTFMTAFAIAMGVAAEVVKVPAIVGIFAAGMCFGGSGATFLPAMHSPCCFVRILVMVFARRCWLVAFEPPAQRMLRTLYHHQKRAANHGIGTRAISPTGCHAFFSRVPSDF